MKLKTVFVALWVVAAFATGCTTDHAVIKPVHEQRAAAFRQQAESTTALTTLKDGLDQASRSGSTQSVTLVWDASPSPGVAYYRIFSGTNGANYTMTTDVGLVLTHTLILPRGDHWFFAAVAVDANGIESAMSNQARWDANLVEPLVRNEILAGELIKP